MGPLSIPALPDRSPVEPLKNWGPNMGSLDGQTAVVTGGSRGLGRGIVEALAGEGARVVAVARDAGHLARLREEVRGDVVPVQADAASAVAAAQIIDREHPRVLVLNAGAIGVTRPTRKQTWETFSQYLEVDLRSVFNWTREALVLPLEKGSRIVIVSSAGAMRASPASANYAAAKAAIWSFARSVAPEAKELGIHVHCVLPGLAPETELGALALRTLAKATGVSEDEFAERRAMKPFVTPALMGKQVLEILTDPTKAEVVSFRVTGRGLQSIPEPT
jgi:NAD(P)-dependent dehydrogenase (short-subunit alcohol dehydrogenase family)